MPSRPDYCPELIALAVHEFRTPVTVVAGYLRMLLRHHGEALTAQQRKLLEEAEKSCGRLTALISQLSDLANLQAGTRPIAQHAVPIFSLLAEVAKGVHEGEDRNVCLEVKGGDPAALVAGDPTQLDSAFGSLFTAVLRERVERCVVLAQGRVVDEDASRLAEITIAESRLLPSLGPINEAAWGPFERWRGGLGFVLPIAEQVIAAHGGRVWSPRANPRAAIGVTLPITAQETSG